jgi:hypothetical protein
MRDVAANMMPLTKITAARKERRSMGKPPGEVLFFMMRTPYSSLMYRGSASIKTRIRLLFAWMLKIGFQMALREET